MSGSDSDSFLSADEATSSPYSAKGSASKAPRKGKTNELSSTSKIKDPEIQDNQDDNDEGWGDFDDWNENDASAKETLEPSRAPPPPPSTSSSSTGVVSNYNIFPVLNDLGGKAKPKDPTRLEKKPEIETKEAEKMPDATQTQQQQQQQQSWGWKSWGGVSSFLSNATESVTALTSQVSSGLASVLENSIGIPDPEEMAKINKENEKLKTEQMDAAGGSKEDVDKGDNKEDTVISSVGNLLIGVTQIGNKVISGGLDTLEGIGKKTMDMLQENDPLLLNKRKLLGLDSDKPVLSQILREAKEKTEEAENNLKEIQKNAYKKQLHFEMLFDFYHGLVHLEALEMLSRQSSLKLQSLLEPLSGKALADMQETLNEVKELCDLSEIDVENDGSCDADELKSKLTSATEDLGVDADFTELIRCWNENTTALKSMENCEAKDVYNKALRCLAESTALVVGNMHKIAELILIKDHHSTANEADSLVQLTSVFCWHLRGVANLFGGKLNSYESNEETRSLITNIFLEESNSSSYVRSAFELLIPILQIGAA